ncbi:efflux RND transporter periplasmic adaptor subunit [Rhizobium sp. A22-96]
MDGPDSIRLKTTPGGGKIALGAITCIAIAGAAIFFALPANESQSAPQATSPALASVPVETAFVSRQDVPIERSGLGYVTPITAVDVKVRADGQLQKVLFSEGQNVKAGDVIAEIDPRPYEAAINQAQAAYRKDIAQLDAAKIDEARARKLTTTGSGTTQTADTAAAQVAIMEATAAGEQAAIEAAKLNLSFATVTAPISGRAGLRQAEQGAIVHTSDTTGIVTITQMQPIAVLFSLPQDELPDLISGQTQNALSVAVDSRDGVRHLADGKLSVIDSQVDMSTGMVKLKAVFANDDLALWPGELVSARIVLRTDRGSTVVPSAAIQNGQTGPYVFIVKSDSTVATVSVKTGPVTAGMTTLLSGPKPGDTVVTSGQSRLTDGTLVKARPSTANVAAAGDQGQ